MVLCSRFGAFIMWEWGFRIRIEQCKGSTIWWKTFWKDFCFNSASVLIQIFGPSSDQLSLPWFTVRIESKINLLCYLRWYFEVISHSRQKYIRNNLRNHAIFYLEHFNCKRVNVFKLNRGNFRNLFWAVLLFPKEMILYTFYAVSQQTFLGL